MAIRDANAGGTRITDIGSHSPARLLSMVRAFGRLLGAMTNCVI